MEKEKEARFMSWFTVDRVRSNTTTGARSMHEHRIIKREQAEARNRKTPPERTRQYRRDNATDT